MKLRKTWPILAVFTIALYGPPNASWAARSVGGRISGEITAISSSGTIKVGGHTYRVRANSAAQKAARKLSVGQVVELKLERAGGGREPEVVAIAKHAS